MLGTIVNFCDYYRKLISLIFRRGIPEKYKNTVMNGIALAVVLIGLMSALKTERMFY